MQELQEVPEGGEADSILLQTAPAAPDTGGTHREAAPLIPRRYAAERASFSVQVKEIVSPYLVFGLFVMPGETIDLETVFTRPGDAYVLAADAGTVAGEASGQWQWTAPEQPGAYTLRVTGPFETMTLNVFVKTPFDNANPVLNGYRVGAYESRPLRGNLRFKPPRGLVEVNEETAGLRVSPHFTLGAFACHQPGRPNKYVILDERLLLKLEMLLEALNRNGVAAQTFTVMSGYRTPWYNKSIGNTTRYSLHLYGRAADVYIDDDRDGRMDDINGDGRVDVEDARMLYTFVDDMKERSWYQPFLGGLGLYGPKPHRGPFVHVDTRGYVARW